MESAMEQTLDGNAKSMTLEYSDDDAHTIDEIIVEAHNILAEQE